MIVKERKSNLELFRIVSMLVIVAHHYVVNSGLLDLVYDSPSLRMNDIFLLIFGGGGQDGDKLLCPDYRLFYVHIKDNGKEVRQIIK